MLPKNEPNVEDCDRSCYLLKMIESHQNFFDRARCREILAPLALTFLFRAQASQAHA